MSNPTVVVSKQEAFNKFKENWEESLEKAITVTGVQTNREVKPSDLHQMQMYLNNEISYKELVYMISKFGKKIMCNNLCNGNMAQFNDYVQSLKSIDDESEGDTVDERYVSVEEGKALQDHEKGNYAPSHATHLNQGLGSDAGKVSRNNNGYVWKLFAHGYIQTLSIMDVKEMMKDLFQMIPSDYEAQEIANIMNKERKVFEGKILQGEIGDSKLTKSAISIITNRGKDKGLNYEKTDMLGRKARKITEDTESAFGKIIGKATVDGDSIELNRKTVSAIKKLIDNTNQDSANIGALLRKAFPI